ncbi:allophanate hydrolase [Granulicella tundricola]|uniref:Allophanate hydrolase n=1 Tax=Granulicella tundricola (strain ATCC BAA-1859 / DSM 23138 / MP5ACTX9) TaxID=1198114 RepID=E8X3S1_GRATM|nr:allophanate hydrolase [Granulicella tundricola]ADW69349.1 allophanate hydrolase [Granulicella tundricola MP5ACTX9]
MNIEALHREYAAGTTTPAQIVEAIFARIASEGVHPVWISLIPKEQVLQRAAALQNQDPTKLPLYGIPFAVKDNIDVANHPTTAGCPAYAFTPTESATVVAKLEAAGAILIGKTNMDQFATGLVGTRSPYGAPSSVFSKDHISGGSSSGSAVAVASGLVAFSLGTDTAGSGRVPAMFNNLIGLKPSRGVLSTHGVVPACRTLDCVSIFTQTAADAAAVLDVASGPDPKDPYSRTPTPGAGASPWAAASTFKFGVPAPSALQFFGDTHNPALYQAAITALKSLGGEPVEFDLAPLLAAAQLLYKGPWVAERYAVISDFIQAHAAEMDPTVAKIINGAASYTAVDYFDSAYKLQHHLRQTEQAWKAFDLILLPTAPRTFTHAEIAESPIERNSQLGFYTNFVNLLDLSAVAVPAGMRPDGLPFGVTLIGKTLAEAALLPLADSLQRKLNQTLGGSKDLLAGTTPLKPATTPTGTLLMAVVGAHLTGQPLNWQLTDRGGKLVRTCRTHPDYKFYALKNTTPPKPGLVRVPGFEGKGIEVEIWALPSDTVGSFVDGVPQPLSIGKLRLEDGTLVMGFLVEPEATQDAFEITNLGGWRNYLATLKK